MRSRFVAFATGDADYLVATQECRDPDSLRAQLLASFADCRWLGLRVVEIKQGGRRDKRGWVTFVATYLADGATHELRERSLFRRIGGSWRNRWSCRPRFWPRVR